MSLAKLATAPDVARLAHLLERLVAIDTQNPPGRETEAAALLASELEAIGFATEVRPLADIAHATSRLKCHRSNINTAGHAQKAERNPAIQDSGRIRRTPMDDFAALQPSGP